MLRLVQYVVVLKRSAQRQYEELPKNIKQRVLAIMEELRSDPWIGKKLQGHLEGLYSVRVWPFRVVYSISKSTITVTVVAIDHRKDVYR